MIAGYLRPSRVQSMRRRRPDAPQIEAYKRSHLARPSGSTRTFTSLTQSASMVTRPFLLP